MTRTQGISLSDCRAWRGWAAGQLPRQGRFPLLARNVTWPGRTRGSERNNHSERNGSVLHAQRRGVLSRELFVS